MVEVNLDGQQGRDLIEVYLEGQQAVSLSIGTRVIDSYKTIDKALSDSSVNPVENRVVTEKFKEVDSAIEDLLGYEVVEEDLSALILNGYWQMKPLGTPEDDRTSVGEVGNIVVPTKRWDGVWRSIECAVSAGEKYKITGVGSAAGRLYAIVNTDGTLVEIAPAHLSATELVLNIEQDGKLYLSCFVNGGVNAFYASRLSSRYGRFDDIHEEIDELREETEAKQNEVSAQLTSLNSLLGYQKERENLEASIIRGWWKMLVDGENIGSPGDKVTPKREADPTWRCLKYPVKAGEKYIISGTGGSGARLYSLVDTNDILQVIADPSVTKENFELNVTTDGILYCTFSASKSHSVIKEYATLQGISSQNWKRGSFEFGRTCDCDYTSPDIDRFTFPSKEERVITVNGWYDELIAEFPQYVSKENCDDVMASMGIEKPSAIASYPMYIYKFIPPRTPNASAYGATTSEVKRIKAFIVTGTHNEFMGIWDCVNAMRLVCRSWKEDKNLEELRWNAEIYIIPCLNTYGVENNIRTNENGVDLNRNAPTLDWRVQGKLGDNTYSGPEAASEYSTKVMMHYLDAIKPQIFIDHHNTDVGSGDNEGDGKNMIYTHCAEQIGLDIAGAVISQMTRKWKMRYTDTFPSIEDNPTVLFGYSSFDTIVGSIGRYATEQGSLGSTYESNWGILYKNGEYSTSNRATNTPLIATCATEGFLNYLIRSLKVYSEEIGVK